MMRDELSNFARQIWTGLRGFAKFVWKIITLEPPAPSWADIFASCWVQGCVCPRIWSFRTRSAVCNVYGGRSSSVIGLPLVMTALCFVYARGQGSRRSSRL